MEEIKDLKSTFQALPPHTLKNLEMRYQNALFTFSGKIVVLDDDPTGIQTVHEVYVYTDWSTETLKQAFAEENRIFFILTNSRGLTAEQTESLHREIAGNLSVVSRQLKIPFLLVSRSDSTLRGHYPLETEVLRQKLEQELQINYDAEVIMPFFPEGGRFTIGDVHYVEENGSLVPAGMTEFAKDKTFGFASSRLPEWVEEKTGGVCRSQSVCCVTLEELRGDNLELVAEKICRVSGFGKIIVNAVDYDDVKAFVISLLMAMERGKQFIFRTAAAFPKVMGGIADRPMLTRKDLCSFDGKKGGLVIAGSHVRKTTVQLAYLMKVQEACPIEFNQHLVLEPEMLEKEVLRVVTMAEKLISNGQTAVVFTRRARLDVGGNREEELRLAVRISDAVTSIVEKLQVRPAWIIAKGGITSSEIGVKGLRVQRARVLGQILPGVPVWQIGEESKFPGLAYVIFPGNVGSETAMKDVVQALVQ